jgi:hypothetical protein
MANIKKIFTETFEADEDLSDYQYHGVTMSDDRKVDLQDANTDIPCGILQNTPKDTQEAEVLVVGRTPIVAGETIAAGNRIRIDSNGHAMVFEVDTDTTTYCCGFCTVGAEVGEIIEAIVNCINPFKGEE